MALSSLEQILIPEQHVLRMLITELIGAAKAAGLPELDVRNAREALEHNEFRVALDTILTQLFEYDVRVHSNFIAKAREACHSMELDWDQYSFVESLAISR